MNSKRDSKILAQKEFSKNQFHDLPSFWLILFEFFTETKTADKN